VRCADKLYVIKRNKPHQGFKTGDFIMIKIINGKLVYSKTVKLSKKHNKVLSSLPGDQQQDYKLSLLGIKKTRIDIARPCKHNQDKILNS
jgi:hypothetical protein